MSARASTATSANRVMLGREEVAEPFHLQRLDLDFPHRHQAAMG